MRPRIVQNVAADCTKCGELSFLSEIKRESAQQLVGWLS